MISSTLASLAATRRRRLGRCNAYTTYRVPGGTALAGKHCAPRAAPPSAQAGDKPAKRLSLRRFEPTPATPSKTSPWPATVQQGLAVSCAAACGMAVPGDPHPRPLEDEVTFRYQPHGGRHAHSRSGRLAAEGSDVSSVREVPIGQGGARKRVPWSHAEYAGHRAPYARRARLRISN